MPAKDAECCSSKANDFRVESIISVDDRGQMVLPKELRERAGMGPGEKFVLVSWSKDGEVCCMSLIKTEAFGEMVKGFLEPMMSGTASA